MNIVFEDQTAEDVERRGFKTFYGGQSFTTTCCENRPGYRAGIDTPCNAAAGTSARAALLGLLAAAVGALVLLVADPR